METRQKVLIRRCPQYDPDRIAAIVREGMQELKVRPHGRILLKSSLLLPNLAAYAAMRTHRLLNRLSPPAAAPPLK